MAIITDITARANMTDGDVAEYSIKHMIEQGKKAIRPDGACAYRAPDGCACAAGCFIADDEYNPEIEGNSFVLDHIERFLQSQSLIDFLYKHREMLIRLQCLHDSGPNEPEYFVKHIRCRAAEFGVPV